MHVVDFSCPPPLSNMVPSTRLVLLITNYWRSWLDIVVYVGDGQGNVHCKSLGGVPRGDGLRVEF